MTTVILFILVLSVLVFVHELGHFWTARRLGVKAEEFGFGFPPRALGFFKSKSGRWRFLKGNISPDSLAEEERPVGTVYSLNCLPLGGFVKIKGENGEGKQDSDSFAAKALWRRALILSAGVIMNIVLAAALLSVGYMIGLPQSLDEVKASAQVSEAQVFVMEVLPDSVAAQAGLESGDIIKAVEGQKITSNEELQDLVSKRTDQDTSFTIIRGGEEQNIIIRPSFSEAVDRAVIGVSIYASGLVRYPFFTAIWEGIKLTGLTFWLIILAFYSLIRDLIIGVSVSGQVAGPVGIATLTGQVASLGITYLLQFMALLSLNLALVNILPFPALDGGRLLFLLIEKFKGKPVRQSVEAWIHTIGFWLLITLILVITYKDIMRLF
ncbi:MAG: RIP metalloprotease RseP [Patescibacteria group bacterium]|jgi:regulator of sigma E protease|nr:RIP metalloprotease RseP [Patescibacteria group bacterium]